MKGIIHVNEKTVLMPRFLIQSPLFCFLVSIPPSTQSPIPSTQPPVPSVSGLVTSYIYFFQKSFKFLVKMPVVTPKCLILSAFFFFPPVSTRSTQHPVPNVSGLVTSCLYISKSFTFFWSFFQSLLNSNDLYSFINFSNKIFTAFLVLRLSDSKIMCSLQIQADSKLSKL